MSGRLHILTASPWVDGTLSRCLRSVVAADVVLLAGDAVYGCVPGAAEYWRDTPDVSRLVWDHDAALRGIDVAWPFVVVDAAAVARWVARTKGTVTWSV